MHSQRAQEVRLLHLHHLCLVPLPRLHKNSHVRNSGLSSFGASAGPLSTCLSWLMIVSSYCAASALRNSRCRTSTTSPSSPCSACTCWIVRGICSRRTGATGCNAAAAVPTAVSVQVLDAGAFNRDLETWRKAITWPCAWGHSLCHPQQAHSMCFWNGRPATRPERTQGRPQGNNAASWAMALDAVCVSWQPRDKLTTVRLKAAIQASDASA